MATTSRTPGDPATGERDATFTSLSGEPIAPLYTEADLPDPETIGLPGEYPFTRGVYPSMYRGRLWTMRQFAGFGTPEDTNKRFKYLLSQGMTGLSTAFDMPALMGFDCDHPMSRGEVGKEGVAVSSLEDMETGETLEVSPDFLQREYRDKVQAHIAALDLDGLRALRQEIRRLRAWPPQRRPKRADMNKRT